MPTLDEAQMILQARVDALAKGVAEDIVQTLSTALENVQGRVLLLAKKAEQTPSLVRKKKYLEKQQAEISKVLADVYTTIEAETKAKIAEIGKELPAITHKVYTSALPAKIAVELGVPKLSTKTVISWFEAFELDGLLFNQWLSNQAENVKRAVVRASKDALLFTERPSDAATRLSKVIDKSQADAADLIRDSVHGAQQHAEKVYQQENSELFDYYIYRGELDGKICVRCQDLDGTEYEERADAPDPPIHRRCRCRIHPVNEILGLKYRDRPVRLQADGERIGTEKVSGATDFKDMIQDYATSKDPTKLAYAKEMLHKKRFELVSEGKLSVDKLYHGGKFKTIKDLKKEYGL